MLLSNSSRYDFMRAAWASMLSWIDVPPYLETGSVGSAT
jgi:hypothetical protein